MHSWSVESLRDWLTSRVAALSGLDPAAVDGREMFTRYGLDSQALVALAEELGREVGRPVPPMLVWRHPSPFALADHIAGADEAAPLPAPAGTRGADEPVAVVGLACRFPKAPGPEALWHLLAGDTGTTGGPRDAVTDLPAGRWTGRARGGFLDEGVDEFDPAFFGISPREAVHMDPQQRLALELAWEALEDAGVPPSSLGGSRTGVFVGAMWGEYGAGIRADPALITQHTLAGGDPSVIPARVSYTLGLRGPSLQVNTACSSSLVAVHLAARSLRDGECDVALAGGVSLMLASDTMTALTRFGALAPDGRSKAFDARADGYGRGEGAGLVVLKPLSRAVADGDPIYCVVRGSAVNNDGFSAGLTAPSPQAQEAVLRDAYTRAGVAPAGVQYVEAHGTGTALGDPIEAGALSTVLCAGRPADRPLAIGSIKSTIGHLEPAAGIAGLIKVALAMRHRALPPSAHFERPNPHIPFADWHLRVPRKLESWHGDEDGRLLAGVSAFGFGGTNCHVVLEGAAEAPMHLVRLAADTQEQLRRAAGEMAADDETPPVARLAAISPGAGRHRLALSVRDRVGLARGVAGFLDGRAAPGVAAGRVEGHPPKVVFLFGGQGCQWAGMGARLLRQEPAFLAAVARCDAALAPHLRWSVRDLLTSADTGWIESAELAQPAIFAVQVALAELWRHWGVEPAAVAGTSMGEVAAAHVAGALSLDDAAVIMSRRSRIAHRLTGRGAMAVVALPEEEAGELLREYRGQVWVAGSAGPRSTVLSGDRESLRAILDDLAARSVRCGLIRVGYASHSPYVDEVLPELREALAGVRPGPCRTPFYSAATGRRMTGGELTAEHWVRTERAPWRLTDVVRDLLADGYRIFVDADPHPILADAVEQQGGVALPSLCRGERGRSTLTDSLGALYVRGVPMRPAADRPQLLVLSGRTDKALRASASALAEYLLNEPDAALNDVCYTAGAGRDHHESRLAVVASARRETAAALRAAASGAAEAVAGAAEIGTADGGEAPGVVFVFSGQGSQWAGMGRTLLRDEPVFREALAECEEYLRPLTGWSLVAELGAPGRASRLEETEVAQPALFAVQVALARLWRSWGIVPAAVVGHSVGELAAAHVAGALSLAEAIRDVRLRGLLMGGAPGRGAMAAVELPADRVAPLLGRYVGRLVIAAVNDPGSVVLSGEADALAEVVEQLRGEGVHCRELQVGYAFHSPQMGQAAEELERALGSLAAGAARVAIYSSVTGAAQAGEELGAGYWAGNVGRTVRFADAVAAASAAGHRHFLEVGPHPVLLENVRRCLVGRDDAGAVVVGSLRRGEDERGALLRTAGALHVRGFPVDFERLLGPGRVVPLPPYPWQRQRFWLAAPAAGPGGHPLLGSGLASSVRPGTHFWQRELTPVRLPYLGDLRVRGRHVVPAAVFAEMALAAAAETARDGAEVTDLVIEQALDVEEADAPTVQTVLTGRDFQVSSRDGEGWVRHVVAAVRPVPGGADGPAGGTHEAPELIRRRLSAGREGTEHYRRSAAAGIEVGAGLAGIRELWLGPDEVLARVAPPEEERRHLADYRLHPALFEACLHALAAPGDQAAGPRLVTGLGRLRVHRSPIGDLWAHGRTRADGGDLWLLDDDGRVLVEVEGVRLRRPPGGLAEDRLAESLFTVDWRRQDLGAPAARAAASPVGARVGSWLVLADADGSGEALAEELRALGERCAVLTAGQVDPADPRSYRVALEEAAPSGIVQLWRQGTDAASALVAAVTELGWRETPGLWLVTRAAQAAGGQRHPVAVDQARLWGLGRAVALRHPQVRCVRVDLAPEPGRDEARALAAELRYGGRESDIALRAEGRYVARLVRAGRLPERGVFLHGPGSHLVVTADPALARTLTGWLTDHGARNVVVSQAAGEAEVAALIAGVERDAPPLRGVICAEPRSARPLHQRTRESRLDLFVLCSSASSLLGCGDDAPDGTFFDALAHHRRALGQAGLSVSWAPAGLAASGVEPVTPEEAQHALSRAVGSGLPQLAVLRLNLRHWLESFPSAADTALFDGLEQAAVRVQDSGSFRARLAAAPGAQRPALLERHLIEQLALTLRQDATLIDRSATFRGMGLESLMAVELRNRLESTLGLRLSVSLLFTASNVASLAGHVMAALDPDMAAPAPGPADRAQSGTGSPTGSRAGNGTGWEEDVDRMSDAEAKLALLKSIRLADEESPSE